MAESKTIHCPHCNQPYAMTDEQERQYAGQLITCTTCQWPFSVGAQAPQFGQSPPVSAGPMHMPAQGQVDYGTAATAPRTDGLSIASLVAGCAICVPFIAGILAIVFGIIGLKRTRSPHVRGRGFAIAGLVLGIVNIVGASAYLLLMLAIMFPSLNRARETANRVKCASNMRQIGQALMLYAMENDGQYPETLPPLIVTQDITAHVFCCPTTADTPTTATTADEIAEDFEAGGHLSYVYVGQGFGNDAPARAVILYEPLTNHNGDGTNVLYGDGSVAFVNAQQAQTMILQLESGNNPPNSDPTATPTGPEVE
jgi:prepilin-type processing-associated H-X9-DG protein